MKKLFSRILFGRGIGDKMDKGNRKIFPFIFLLVFLCLWTFKWTKNLEESTCKSASIYDFTGIRLDHDAKSHCQTAPRYFVAPDESFPKDLKSREEREVKNPERIYWFWLPILCMVCFTRFMWSLLMDNQGIDFDIVLDASKNVSDGENGTRRINENRLVIAPQFNAAASSWALSAFIFFEFILVLSPMVLLLFILPMMIGPKFRTWGLDVTRAIWEHREWQGVSLAPLITNLSGNFTRPHVPLIPRITYCDFHFDTVANPQTFTYQCFLDATWLERTALFIWMMLFFIAFINFINLLFWIGWAIRMKFEGLRQRWVMSNWLYNDEGFTENEAEVKIFASEFRSGQLLFFYYIEVHTSRDVASAICKSLFRRPPQNGTQMQGPVADDSTNNDPEQGIVSTPSTSKCHSPNEAYSSESTMRVYSPRRHSASSDSSNLKIVVNLPPSQSGSIAETPRRLGRGGPGRGVHRPRRNSTNGTYGRNIQEASKETLMLPPNGRTNENVGRACKNSGGVKMR